MAKIHYASLQSLISVLEEIEPKYMVLSRIYKAVGGNINKIIDFLNNSSRMNNPKEAIERRRRLQTAIDFWSSLAEALVDMSNTAA